MGVKIISYSLNHTYAIARESARAFEPSGVIALAGEIGSGKTAFVKGFAAAFGIRKRLISSPTFVLMRQYKGRAIINHFDLYRLDSIRQLEQIGYEEYFYSEAITLIEWADRAERLLPGEHLRINFKVIGREKRLLEFSPFGFRYENNFRDFKRKTDRISSGYPPNTK